MHSDYGEGKINQKYTLKGHVHIERGSQKIGADQAVYDDRTGMVNATGHVLFQQGGLITKGSSAQINLNNGTGELDSASFQYLQQHASGQADTIIHESTGVLQVDNREDRL